MTKNFLNLDTLTEEEKEFQYNGKTYKIANIPVIKLLEFYKASDGKESNEQITQAIEFFYELCPEAEKERDFDNLNVNQITSLITFLVANLNEKDAPVAEEPAKDTTKKK